MSVGLRLSARLPCSILGNHTSLESPMLQDFDINVLEEILHMCIFFITFLLFMARGLRENAIKPI